MKILPALAVAACVGGLAHARPMIIEERARIANPDPAHTSFGTGVGLDGDHAIVLGYRNIPDPQGTDDTQRTVFLFRLVNGTWTYLRPLASTIEHNEGDGPATVGVDLGNGIAALALQPLQIYERVGTDYVQRFVSSGDSRSAHVQIDGNRILFGGGCWGGSVFVRDAAGTWTGEDFLPGDFCGSTDSATGGPVAISGQWAVVSNPWNHDGELPGPAVTLFTNTFVAPNPWEQTQRIVLEPGHWAGHVAMWDFRLFVEDLPRFGTAIYERNDIREWGLAFRRLLSGGEWMALHEPGSVYHHAGSIETSADYVMRHAYDHDLQNHVVQVFQYGLNEYLHVATLVPSDGGVLTGQISISGRRVLLAGGGHAYYYELPESLKTPALLQDTFPGTTAPGWTVLPGSRFSIAQRSDSRVFRQSSTEGEAGAVFNAANWTNQAIHADLRPRAVNGNDRWAGLATRRSDAANYYYVTLRSSGVLELKRMYQGAFQTLASASVPFALHRNYRLRLESMGSLHSVYLDGNKLLEARDHALTQGRPGLLSYRAAADYDNVVVSPSPVLTIYQQDSTQTCSENCPPWNYTGGRWLWQHEAGNLHLSQTSLTDWSRAFAGEVTENPDMVVEARARLRAFGAGTDPWFGIAARGGETSYTYLALRKSNTVTLRRVDQGVITQLGSAVFNVTPGAWYRLRLEAVGNRLRGYVNDRLVLETTDSQAFVGRGGLVTYRTQADFDDYRAVRP